MRHLYDDTVLGQQLPEARGFLEYLALGGAEGVIQLDAYVAAGAKHITDVLEHLVAGLILAADVCLGVVDEQVVDYRGVAGQVRDELLHRLDLIGVGRVRAEEYLLRALYPVFVIGDVPDEVGPDRSVALEYVLHAEACGRLAGCDLEIVDDLLEVFRHSERSLALDELVIELLAYLMLKYPADIVLLSGDHGQPISAAKGGREPVVHSVHAEITSVTTI